MPFAEGNRFWEARSKHGPDRRYDNPDDLWNACLEYFEWVEENPLWESKATQYQGDVIEMTLPKMRAMTIDGLCLFLDIDDSTWQRWRERDDLRGVVGKADRVIRSQKFAGAAADLLNANIIARDLGLRDGVDNTHSGKLDLNTQTEHSLDAELMSLLRKAAKAD